MQPTDLRAGHDQHRLLQTNRHQACERRCRVAGFLSLHGVHGLRTGLLRRVLPSLVAGASLQTVVAPKKNSHAATSAKSVTLALMASPRLRCGEVRDPCGLIREPQLAAATYNDDASGQFTSTTSSAPSATRASRRSAPRRPSARTATSATPLSGSDCVICDAGRYAAEKGSAECSRSPGEYQPATGGIQCRDCGDLGRAARATRAPGTVPTANLLLLDNPVGCDGPTGDSVLHRHRRALLQACANLEGFDIKKDPTSRQ